jgi:Mg-chelatase subunit ChlI
MNATSNSYVLPFTSLVGQEQLKLALRMLAVDPRLGGVLIRGEKGTAKSTAARALASLLPTIRVNAGCRFGCPSERPSCWCNECRGRSTPTPEDRRPAFETLPLGITADQLLGTIDLEHALREGTQRFAPGLLARVNQGALYVDEVNLLEDHVVDLLLDAAAMGVNVVAREGISISHPAEFMLIGTMNPEEGQLRPQLLDRFGLCVDVHSLSDVEARADVVIRRLAFEADPARFFADWREQEQAVAASLVEARRLLPKIPLERRWGVAAAKLAIEMAVDGHRADVLLVKGAATVAALAGRVRIEAGDIVEAARVVMPHRLRRRPFEEESAEPAEIIARAEEIVERAVQDEKKKLPT